MKVFEIRKVNLQALAEIHGAANLSAKLGYRQPSFLSQMIGPNPTRQLSEKNARQYEEVMGLPAGYLDRPLFPHTETQAAAEVDQGVVVTVEAMPDLVPEAASIALLKDTIQTVARLIKAENVEITVDQFAKLLVIELADAAKSGIVRESHVKQMLEMLK